MLNEMLFVEAEYVRNRLRRTAATGLQMLAMSNPPAPRGLLEQGLGL